MTAKRRKQYLIWAIFSFLCFFGPTIFYCIQAFINGTALVQKFTLAASFIVVLIMSAVCLINKTVVRSRIWIILLALFVCLDSYLQPILFIGIGQILDQLLCSPLKNKYKRLLQTNKEIDAR